MKKIKHLLIYKYIFAKKQNACYNWDINFRSKL